MTNSFNDMHNAKAMLFLGSNAAEAHPIAMQHVLRGKENGSKMIVVDPRFTRTAAHADIYARLRSGTDIPFLYGLLWHIFKNGWEDKEFIAKRVYAMDDIRKEAEKWPPEVVENVSGVPKDKMHLIAKTMAENRPGTIVWCMGVTQHHMGTQNARLFCILQLALGNVGMSGGGANIFRGHDNVQGATDVGPNCHTLSCYYGLAEGSWKHWCRVWGVDYEWIKSRFDMSQQYDAGGGKMAYTMNIEGIPVSRWIDGVLEDKQNLSQKDNLRAVIFQGHACNSQTRGTQMKKALEKLDLVVISDPHPTHMAVMSDRKNDTYLLPTCTQYETSGSATASNRALQWREKVIEPLFESLPDHAILYKLAKKLGFAEEMFKNIKVVKDEPVVEDVLREINRGAWTIGYTGQSPERLKLHAKYRKTFDTTTSRAEGGPCKGEYYGLPWPCWGTPEMKHPGTPLLYDPSKPVAEGGLVFRANWGTERDGQSLLAERRLFEGLGDQGRLPGIHRRHPQEARLVERPDRGREEGGRGEELEDRPLRRHPAGGDQARLRALRERPGPLPRLGIPRSHPGPPRAAVHAAVRPGEEIPDLRRTARPSIGSPPGTSRSSRSTTARNTRWCSPAAGSSSTKGAARRRAPTPGWPNCSPRCSPRSTRRTRPMRTSGTGSTSGSRGPKGAGSRCGP